MIQIPANVCGWRANFKSPDKSDIPRVQCDPVQAHQSILGLTEEYKDKVTRDYHPSEYSSQNQRIKR